MCHPLPVIGGMCRANTCHFRTAELPLPDARCHCGLNPCSRPIRAAEALELFTPVDTTAVVRFARTACLSFKPTESLKRHARSLEQIQKRREEKSVVRKPLTVKQVNLAIPTEETRCLR
ncbi:hypothetical protein SRHO_G00299550 [Serrasalmus rhombeus]